MKNRISHIRELYSCLVAASVLLAGAGASPAALPLETETARIPPVGAVTVSGAFEHQTSSEGKESAMPFALEYGLTKRIELLVEPVPYSAIRPKIGPRATGPGDLEVTAVLLLSHEGRHWPAFAAAGEIKLPTAHDKLIGTGETDYAGYLIASRHFGRFDAHANLAYTIVGQPRGVKLDNLASYAVALEYKASPNWELVSEAYGNTSATKETVDGGPAVGESSIAPEASGGESVAVIGVRYLATAGLHLSLGVSYDNNQAVVFAPGITTHFR